jgi:hypothetical protein
LSPQFLRRYTTLPVLLDIIMNKKLTLLDPRNWEDKNDSHYIAVYKTQLNLKSVLALCFTEADETYHHWKVFSGNSGGICIQFNKEKLLKCCKPVRGLRCGNVIYRKITEARAHKPSKQELLFLKRYPFRDEKEYRLIYESPSEDISAKDVPITMPCIDRIIFNPWISRPVFNSVKAVIKNINGCKTIRVSRTTLVNNEEWKEIGGTLA